MPRAVNDPFWGMLSIDINRERGCREETCSCLFFLWSYIPMEINIQKDRQVRKEEEHDLSA